jgi:hypothetical protein
MRRRTAVTAITTNVVALAGTGVGAFLVATNDGDDGGPPEVIDATSPQLVWQAKSCGALVDWLDARDHYKAVRGTSLEGIGIVNQLNTAIEGRARELRCS